MKPSAQYGFIVPRQLTGTDNPRHSPDSRAQAGDACLLRSGPLAPSVHVIGAQHEAPTNIHMHAVGREGIASMEKLHGAVAAISSCFYSHSLHPSAISIAKSRCCGTPPPTLLFNSAPQYPAPPRTPPCPPCHSASVFRYPRRPLAPSPPPPLMPSPPRSTGWSVSGAE